MLSPRGVYLISDLPEGGGYLLLCNSFREQRCSLLAGVNDVLKACGHSESAYINMLQLLLYENKYLPLEANKLILDLTIKYISETERFG